MSLQPGGRRRVTEENRTASRVGQRAERPASRNRLYRRPVTRARAAGWLTWPCPGSRPTPSPFSPSPGRRGTASSGWDACVRPARRRREYLQTRRRRSVEAKLTSISTHKKDNNAVSNVIFSKIAENDSPPQKKYQYTIRTISDRYLLKVLGRLRKPESHSVAIFPSPENGVFRLTRWQIEAHDILIGHLL